MQPFDRLLVWDRAHGIALELHHLTLSWRDWELRSQLRRCATSVAANIAEGGGSETRAQFARYLSHAQASASELRYHLRYARDVGLLDAIVVEPLDARVEEVRRMLTGLSRALRRPDASRDAHRGPAPK